MTGGAAGWRAPVLAALATAALFTAAGSVQYARGGWPFSQPDAHPRQSGGSASERSRIASVDAPDRIPIQVNAAAADRLGVRLETVRMEALPSTVRALATVAIDESRLSRVHTRVAGWVEQLYVNTTGQAVRAGQPLARVFSQELLSSQTEYLAARSFAASGQYTSVVASGRTRLKVLGMTDGEIAMIERSGRPLQLVTITAPRSGVVVNRGVSAGTAVDPSTELLTLADLSRVWIFAELAETDIPAVRVGATAMLDFPSSGLPPFPARVEFVYPTLTERTRTLRVRMSAPNPEGVLKPGLYGTAVFESAAGRGIMAPRDAIVDSGRRQHVFVVKGDMFEPRPVTLGARLADRVVVLKGLAEGERIVASGVFLLDSESRLRATGGASAHAHGTSAAPAEPTRPTPSPPAGHSGPGP